MSGVARTSLTYVKKRPRSLAQPARQFQDVRIRLQDARAQHLETENKKSKRRTFFERVEDDGFDLRGVEFDWFLRLRGETGSRRWTGGRRSSPRQNRRVRTTRHQRLWRCN